eukprot:6201122-Pleurochrysis_carterae.AAC.1
MTAQLTFALLTPRPAPPRSSARACCYARGHDTSKSAAFRNFSETSNTCLVFGGIEKYRTTKNARKAQKRNGKQK